MALAALSSEQIEEIRAFCLSPAAELLFEQLESGAVADWINCPEPVGRETHWHIVQAILRLKAQLRDSAAMKRLSDRIQERRTYAT
jgi:hypothetical protein